MVLDWLKKLFKKKEVISEPLPPSKIEPEPKIEMSTLSGEQKIEVLSARMDAMNERIKNIERMVEEIYRIAKS